MTADADADARLHAGREALRLATERAAGAEDLPHDAALLAEARAHFEAATSLFHHAGRAAGEARARLGTAEAFLKLPPSDDTCAAAEASARAAIALLDTAADPAAGLDAYLVLAEAMVTPLPHAGSGPETEGRVDRALGVLRAAAYLADRRDDPLGRARVDEHVSRALGERFRGDRDANLLDAIRAGRRALPALRERHARSPGDYPSLQAHLGNCYMKLDGPRDRWLREGLAAYRDGLAAADPQRWPRLHRLLAGHTAMAEALIAEGNLALPEKEVMARHGTAVQAALDAGDHAAADAAAWEMLRWAWSLPRTPNVWVGEAHKILGNLLLVRDEAGAAQSHFYSAAAVLAAVSDPGGPRQAALLHGAEQLLADAMARLGQAELTARLAGQARQALGAARARVAQGAELLATDLAAAHEQFDRALALFPYDPVALFYRGVASMAMGDGAGALRDYDAALHLQPRSVAALANRALVRANGGDVPGALADYGAVLDLDPRNAIALRNRAVLRAHVGEREGAAADLGHLLDATTDPDERAAIEAQIRRLRGEGAP